MNKMLAKDYVRFLASEAGWSSWEHWCVDSQRCGTSTECNGSNTLYIVIIVLLIVGVLGCWLIWIIIIYWRRYIYTFNCYRKRFRKQLEQIKKEAMQHVTKKRRRRGISIGFLVPKIIPMRTAEVRDSVELDKLNLINRDLYKEVMKQNPSFELLFEKNLPSSAYDFSDMSSKFLIKLISMFIYKK